jgi:hypothetical protein
MGKRKISMIATDEAIVPIAMLITTRKAFSSLSIIFSLCPQLAGLRGWVQKQWRKGHSIKQSKRFFKAGIMPSTPGVEPSALSHGC